MHATIYVNEERANRIITDVDTSVSERDASRKGIVQLDCTSSFTRDAFVASLPLLIIVIAPRRRPFLKSELLRPKHRAFAVSPHKESHRETIIILKASLYSNAIVRSEISLRHVLLGGRESRKEYIRHSRCDYDTSRNDFGTIADELVALTSIDRCRESIDRDDTHPDSHQASPPGGRSRNPGKNFGRGRSAHEAQPSII